MEWKEKMDEAGTRVFGYAVPSHRKRSLCGWVGMAGFRGHEHVVRG